MDPLLPLDDPELEVNTLQTDPNAVQYVNPAMTDQPPDPRTILQARVRNQMAAQQLIGPDPNVAKQAQQGIPPAQIAQNLQLEQQQKAEQERKQVQQKRAKQAKALAQKPQEINALQNFVNAGYKSFARMTKGNIYHELFQRDPDAADRFSEELDIQRPTYDGISETLGEVAGSIIPTIAALAATLLPEPVSTAAGLAMLGTYGASAGGAGVGGLLRYERDTGENVADWAEPAVIAGYAAAELIAERMRFKWLKKLAPEAAQELGESLMRVTDFVPTLAKIMARNSFQEATEESLTQVAQNIADLIYKPIDQWQGPWEGVPESAAMGALGGAMMAGAQIPVGAVQNVREARQRQEMKAKSGAEITRRFKAGEALDSTVVHAYTGFEATDLDNGDIAIKMPNGDRQVLVRQVDAIKPENEESFFTSIRQQIEAGKFDDQVKVGSETITIPKTYEEFKALDQAAKDAIDKEWVAPGLTAGEQVEIKIGEETIQFEDMVVLAKIADAETFNHEVWHVIRNAGLLDDADLRTLARQFDDEEAEAIAFEDYAYGGDQPIRAFDKIVEFMRDLLVVGRQRTAEEIQQQAAIGKGFTGEAGRVRGDQEPQERAQARRDLDYRGTHQAPSGEHGEGSLDAMDKTYPDDLYSNNGPLYYGDRSGLDEEAHRIIMDVKGNPDAVVKVFRAVPKGSSDAINPGDWVTTVKGYAELHGERFEQGFDVLEQDVIASELFTEGNSIHEYGWSPKTQQYQARRTPTLQSVTPEQDKAYMAAAEAGDVETAQRMVDEAAKAAGYTERLFHGTRTSPDVFKKINGMAGHFGSEAAAEDKVWFDSNEMGKPGEPNVLQVLLQIKNPVRMTDVHFDEAGTMAGDLLDRNVVTRKDIRSIDAEASFHPNEGETYVHFGSVKEGAAISALVDLLQSKGFDGIVYENRVEDPGHDSWIPFSSNQIKSADPITRDDQGNIIPLSERFNEASDDIRYQAQRRGPTSNPGRLPTARGLIDRIRQAHDPGHEPQEPIIEEVENDFKQPGYADQAIDDLIDRGLINWESETKQTETDAVATDWAADQWRQNPTPENLERAKKTARAWFGVGTNWGREGAMRRDRNRGTPAENAWSKFSKVLFNLPDHKLNRVLNDLKKAGLDPNTIDWSDLKQVDKAFRIMSAVSSSKWDKLYEYWISMGLLSAPATQMANITGNSLSAAVEFLVQQPVEIALNKMLTPFLAKEDRRYFSEIGAGVKGLLAAHKKQAEEDVAAGMQGFFNGFGPAAQAMVASFAREKGVFEDEFLHRGTGHAKHTVTGAIGGRKGQLARTPLRMLLAADEYFKTTFGHMAAYQSAERRASQQGLRGQERADYIAKQLREKNSDSWKDGLDMALFLTFQEDAGKLAKFVNIARSKDSKGNQMVPGVRWIIPFVTVVGNILSVGFRKSPLGSITLVRKMAKAGLVKVTGVNDGEIMVRPQELVRGAAEQIIAWTALMALLPLVWGEEDEEDLPRITGSIMPQRENWRQAWQNGVIQPYSIRLGDRYFSYNRIEPVGTTLALIIDHLVAAQNVKSGQEFQVAFGKAYREIAQVALDKTFLYGLSDLMESFRDDRHALSWVQNFATSFSPNIIRSSLKANDPLYRQYKNTEKDLKTLGVRTLQKAWPSVGFAPPARVNIWGEDIGKTSRPGGSFMFELMGNSYEFSPFELFSPSKVMDITDRRSIDLAILRWNEKVDRGTTGTEDPRRISLSAPHPHVSYRGVRHQMTEDQYYQFMARRGELAWRMLRGRIPESRLWDPEEREAKLILSTFRKATNRAKNEIRQEVLQNPR